MGKALVMTFASHLHRNKILRKSTQVISCFIIPTPQTSPWMAILLGRPTRYLSPQAALQLMLLSGISAISLPRHTATDVGIEWTRLCRENNNIFLNHIKGKEKRVLVMSPYLQYCTRRSRVSVSKSHPWP